nr:MAG TPA: hypothetical protein [Caudoviricetes sp.]
MLIANLSILFFSFCKLFIDTFSIRNYNQRQQED